MAINIVKLMNEADDNASEEQWMKVIARHTKTVMDTRMFHNAMTYLHLMHMVRSGELSVERGDDSYLSDKSIEYAYRLYVRGRKKFDYPTEAEIWMSCFHLECPTRVREMVGVILHGIGEYGEWEEIVKDTFKGFSTAPIDEAAELACENFIRELKEEEDDG